MRFRLLVYLTRSARGGAAAVVLVFSLLLSLAVNAGFFGIPLMLIITSWFFKYAYILFDHTVHGFADPPVLDIQMLNPVDEQRPLAQLVILGGVFGGLKLAFAFFGIRTAFALGCLAAFLVPASVAVLGLEGNLLKAVYPPMLLRLVQGLGWMYGAVLGLIVLCACILWGLERLGLWLPLQLACSLFVVLSAFSTLAGALYLRRHELGLETWHSPERTRQRERSLEDRRRDALVTEAYGLMRVGSHAKASDLLRTWLADNGGRVDDYRWLCDRVTSWDDPRYANRLTEEYVDRLMALKQSGEALDVVSRRLKVDPGFRPKSAQNTFAIAQLAARGGGLPGVARTLLSGFAERFPGDPSLPGAATLARHLGESPPDR